MKKSLLLAACALVCASASAQDSWPSRPVKVVVPSSPGGGTDLYARLLSQALSESLKQQFVVDNRPGASGNIGAEAAAKAAPDGYTILVSANPALTVNPHLYRNLPYNTERDLVPVARGVIAPQVVVVHPGVKARSIKELIELTDGNTIGSSSATAKPELAIRLWLMATPVAVNRMV